MDSFQKPSKQILLERPRSAASPQSSAFADKYGPNNTLPERPQSVLSGQYIQMNSNPKHLEPQEFNFTAQRDLAAMQYTDGNLQQSTGDFYKTQTPSFSSLASSDGFHLPAVQEKVRKKKDKSSLKDPVPLPTFQQFAPQIQQTTYMSPLELLSETALSQHSLSLHQEFLRQTPHALLGGRNEAMSMQSGQNVPGFNYSQQTNMRELEQPRLQNAPQMACFRCF